jgi:hypothetical protein
MKKLFIFGVLVLSFFLMSTSYSQLLVEDFNYPVGDSIDTHGWTPHSGTGTTPVLVSNGGLTYADYLGSGIGNAADVFGTGEDVNKDFTVQGTDGSSIYMSALVNVTEAANSLSGGYFLHLGKTTTPTTFTSFCSRVFVSVDASDSVNFGLSNTSTGTYSLTKFVKNTTYLLIVKYTINTAGNDTTKLWVVSSGVPIDEITAGTPDVLIDSQIGTSTDSVNAVGIRQSSGIPDVVLDGIRVGTSWDDIFSVVSSPTISVAPTTLLGFTYVEGSGPSTSQSYKLSGSDLDPADGNITVTGSTNYEVSTDDINFSGSFDVAYTGGVLSDTTIYVRLAAGLSTGDYNGEILSNSGGGATTKEVTVDGSVTAEPGLAGDYYIGTFSPNGTPDFATLEEAFNAINNSNITGDCIFYITSSITEPNTNHGLGLAVDPSPYTITIKPYLGTYIEITLQYPVDINSGPSGAFVIGIPSDNNIAWNDLRTTKNIIIDGSNNPGGASRDLVFRTETTSARNAFPLAIVGDVSNVTVKNCIFEYKPVAVSTSNLFIGAVQIRARNNGGLDWVPSNITIDNNLINADFPGVARGAQGIVTVLLGTATASYVDNLVIKNNTIMGKQRAIALGYSANTDIYNNTIELNQDIDGTVSNRGIEAALVAPGSVVNIFNNRISKLASIATNDQGMAGISVLDAGTYNIYNNMISGFSLTSTNPQARVGGIGISSTTATSNIYYNSILMNDIEDIGTGSVAYYGIGTINGIINIANNLVVANESDFKNFCISTTGGTLTSNFNDFYTATDSACVGYFIGIITPTLADWQTASGQDANSVSKEVFFKSPLDLHLTGTSDGDFSLAGTPVTGITTDIDGDTRNTTYPYMGADEGTISLTEPVDFWVEDFDYPDGDTLTNFNGWIAHSGAGINPITINSFGLAFPDYKSSGIGLAALMDNTSEDVHKLFPSVSNGTVYTSFMVRVDAAPTGYFLHFAPNPHNTFDFRGRVWVKTNGSGGLAIGYSYSSSDTTFTDFDYNLGDTLLFVSKYEVVAGDNNDIVSLYIFNNSAPAPSTEPVSPTVGPIVNATTSADIDPGSINLRQYNSGQNIIVDGIRVATSWNDVFGIVSGVEITESKIPTDYTLTQNYPNPFNPTTRINYSVPFDSKVTISVYSITGELVAELVNDYKSVGTYSVNFDGSNLASGMYIYRMVAGSFVQTNKMMLLK